MRVHRNLRTREYRGSGGAEPTYRPDRRSTGRRHAAHPGGHVAAAGLWTTCVPRNAAVELAATVSVVTSAQLRATLARNSDTRESAKAVMRTGGDADREGRWGEDAREELFTTRTMRYLAGSSRSSGRASRRATAPSARRSRPRRRDRRRAEHPLALLALEVRQQVAGDERERALLLGGQQRQQPLGSVDQDRLQHLVLAHRAVRDARPSSDQRREVGRARDGLGQRAEEAAHLPRRPPRAAARPCRRGRRGRRWPATRRTASRRPRPWSSPARTARRTRTRPRAAARAAPDPEPAWV